MRRLRPRLDLGRDYPGLLGNGRRATSRRETLGHRLQFENPGLLPRQFAWLQYRAWADAVGTDWREPRELVAAVSRRVRRRRLRIDRHRPVRTRHAARCEHGLHPREQRRIWLDQGPILGDRRSGLTVEEGRDQFRHTHRRRQPRPADGRHLRRPRFQW